MLICTLLELYGRDLTGGGKPPLGGFGCGGGFTPQSRGVQPSYFFRASKKNTPPGGGCNQSIFFIRKKSLLCFLKAFKRLLRVLEALLVPLEVFTDHTNPLAETFFWGLVVGEVWLRGELLRGDETSGLFLRTAPPCNQNSPGWYLPPSNIGRRYGFTRDKTTQKLAYSRVAERPKSERRIEGQKEGGRDRRNH